MNLLVNALDAMNDAGRLCVRTSRLSENVIRVEIEDSGAGIPPEIIDRIFDPFFTTKPVGKGTGLGLALSYGIVTRHGGTIQVESQPGRGSTFRVELLAQQEDGKLLENAHQDIVMPGEEA